MRAGANWIPELNFGDDFKTTALCKLDYEDPATHNKVALVVGAAGGVGSFGVQLFSKVFKAKKFLLLLVVPKRLNGLKVWGLMLLA